MKVKNKTLMIGIGGVSRAGKTELSNFLCQKFKSFGYSAIAIHQDQFTFSTHEIPKVKNRVDWETPESIDIQKYHFAIQEAQQKEFDVIITEGFLNFHDEKFVQLFDKKIFVEIKRSTFEKRKAQDNRWGSEPKWYIDHIWKSYEKYGKTILASNSDLLRIFGENRSSYQTVWDYVFPEKMIESKR